MPVKRERERERERLHTKIEIPVIQTLLLRLHQFNAFSSYPLKEIIKMIQRNNRKPRIEREST